MFRAFFKGNNYINVTLEIIETRRDVTFGSYIFFYYMDRICLIAFVI